jgi:hypothetical protein
MSTVPGVFVPGTGANTIPKLLVHRSPAARGWAADVPSPASSATPPPTNRLVSVRETQPDTKTPRRAASKRCGGLEEPSVQADHSGNALSRLRRIELMADPH